MEPNLIFETILPCIYIEYLTAKFYCDSEIECKSKYRL